MKEKIIITGGGTGGHIFPMLAVADSLKSEYEVILLLSRDKIFKQSSIFKNFSKYYILSGKVHRHHSIRAYLQSLLNLLKFALGILQALFLLLFIRPRVIFSKGGFGSLPTVTAGHILRIPIVIHESDLTLGLANRLALKYAKKICVSFPTENYNLPLNKIVYSGHILRDLKTNPEVSKKLKLNANLPTLLVTGGSQGAFTINKNIARLLPELLPKMNIIHLSGEKDFPWLLSNKENLGQHEGVYFLESFSTEIIDFMAISDIILSRAGSNSLAEIAALKKPSIIIPYRYASADHQVDNAAYFNKSAASIVIAESELTPDKLRQEIISLIGDKERLKIIGENAYKANSFEGVSVITEVIKNIINNGN